MNRQNAFIEWDPRFMLGVPLIDGQHERLVQLTNNLHVACRDSKENANDCFIRVAHEAVNYVRYHFTTEEKMMLLLMFPEYTEHKKHHEIFIREVLHQTQMFANKKNLVPNRFVHFLRDWVLSHIAVRDKVFTEYILSLKNQEKLEMIFSSRI